MLRDSPITAWAGAALLVATALFHATGYRTLAEAARAPALDPRLGSVLPALWLFPSVHWIVLALLCALAAVFPGRLSVYILAIGAAAIAVDAALLLLVVGPFIGEAMLAVSALLFAVAAVQLRGS